MGLTGIRVHIPAGPPIDRSAYTVSGRTAICLKRWLDEVTTSIVTGAYGRTGCRADRVSRDAEGWPRCRSTAAHTATLPLHTDVAGPTHSAGGRSIDMMASSGARRYERPTST